MKKLLLWCFLVSGLALGQAHAAVLQIDPGSGKLTGATGVSVAGTLYDVSFQDGTCTAVFSGCELSDFVFPSGASALAASQALLDQVFLDVGGSLDTAFDIIPGLTQGCATLAQSCVAVTPYSLGNGIPLFVGSAVNHGAFDGLADVAQLEEHQVGADLSGDPAQVFAVWSLSPAAAAPEGPTLGLVCAGLFALVVLRLRRAERIVRLH